MPAAICMCITGRLKPHHVVTLFHSQFIYDTALFLLQKGRFDLDNKELKLYNLKAAIFYNHVFWHLRLFNKKIILWLFSTEIFQTQSED
jgi:hypothetical protein